jgi:hypothetical protein
LIKYLLFVQNVWDIQASYVEYLVCDVTVSFLKLKYIVHAVLITSLSV